MDKLINAGYKISTDPERIDIKKLHSFLANESYWAKDIPIEVLEKSIQNSINFSLLSPKNEFIGFGRIITDYATFAYLSDVYINKNYRDIGLGKLLIKSIMDFHEIQGLRLWLLATKDAHGLYKQFGWENLENPELFMAILQKKRIKRI